MSTKLVSLVNPSSLALPAFFLTSVLQMGKLKLARLADLSKIRQTSKPQEAGANLTLPGCKAQALAAELP